MSRFYKLTIKKVTEILLILLLITLLFSNVLSELILIFLILIFLHHCNLRNFIEQTREPVIFTFLIFFLVLIINSIINFENNPSFQRTFFFIRFPIFVLSISYFINQNIINLDIIIKYWGMILLIIFFDLIFQYFNGVNLLGFESIQQGNINRLGGFMNSELKISNLIFHFSTIVFSYFYSKNYYYSKKFTHLSLFFLFISVIVIFLTAERSNFISSFIFFILIIIIVSFHNKKLFTNFLVIILILTPFLLYSNNNLTKRMITDLIPKLELFKKDKDKSFLYKDSHYFAHYSTAYQIFQNNKLFGVGLKNFRNFCDNDNFNNDIHPDWINKKCSTHPHSFYFEFISELGIIGLLTILIAFTIAYYNFFKIFLKTRDFFLLFNSLIILIYFIPIPRGSFFNNWNAIIFWTIFGILYARYIKLKNKNV